MTRKFRRSALFIAALVTAMTAGVAFAQTSALQVAIRSIEPATDGTTRVVVSVTGSAVTTSLGDSNFTVTEAGQPINNFVMLPLTYRWIRQSSLKVLAIDSVFIPFFIPDRPPVALRLPEALR